MKENNIEKDITVLKDLKNKWELNAFGNMVNVLSLNEIKALEHILSDYKKLQEDFEQIDNECNRLEAKEFKLENKINKLKDEMVSDKMEQFDDYVIYLIEKYLNILEG